MITLVTQGSMWPIRKRDDGDEERGGQVVMNGGGWGEVTGGRTFRLQLLLTPFTQVAFLALRCGRNKY